MIPASGYKVPDIHVGYVVPPEDYYAYGPDEAEAAYEEWIESQIDAEREERIFGRP